jgi:hypothetical protein
VLAVVTTKAYINFELKEGTVNKLLCLFIGMSFLISCGGKQPKVDKVIEDGVEVVLNHLEPYQLKGQPSRLRLEEETRIDFEREEYASLGLKEPYFAEADATGNIYVVEFYQESEFHIYQFNAAGELIKKFGKHGQGPGELQGINDLVTTKNGHVQVADRTAGRIVEFDADASFVKEIRVPPHIRETIALENGYYLGRRTPKDASEPRGYFLCLFDAEFNELKKLDFIDMSEMAPGKKTPGTILAFLWRVAGGRIYAGNEQRGYEILVYDLEGNLLRKIRKEYDPVPYPEEFRKQTEVLAARQPAMNLFARKDMLPFNSFFVDDEGRLFVMTYEPGNDQDAYIHDVFDRDGVLVARVPLGKYGILGRSMNPLRATSKNGRFYRVRFKESGYAELVVYKMLWE